MTTDTLHWSNADVEVHKVVVGPVREQRVRRPLPSER